MEQLEKINEILTNVTNQMEQECGFPNASFVVALILLFMNPTTWTFDKSNLAKLYRAIDIIEKNEELKELFSTKQEGKENVNENVESKG